VREGRAARGDGTLAGSVGTVADAVRRTVELGASLEQAVAAATTAPARLLGRDDGGTLRPGSRADVVVFDDDVRVARVLAAGTMVEEATQ
jgi:N-acetylglucosamine-6-phosphate deacetylase